MGYLIYSGGENLEKKKPHNGLHVSNGESEMFSVFAEKKKTPGKN